MEPMSAPANSNPQPARGTLTLNREVTSFYTDRTVNDAVQEFLTRHEFFVPENLRALDSLFRMKSPSFDRAQHPLFRHCHPVASDRERYPRLPVKALEGVLRYFAFISGEQKDTSESVRKDIVNQGPYNHGNEIWDVMSEQGGVIYRGVYKNCDFSPILAATNIGAVGQLVGPYINRRDFSLPSFTIPREFEVKCKDVILLDMAVISKLVRVIATDANFDIASEDQKIMSATDFIRRQEELGQLYSQIDKSYNRTTMSERDPTEHEFALARRYLDVSYSVLSAVDTHLASVLSHQGR